VTVQTSRLADTAGFELLDEGLARDIQESVRQALAEGAVFAAGSDPLSVFREALAESIRTIESHERNALFRRFLKDGPYEDSGQIPPGFVSSRLSDDQTAAAIRFIYYRVINYFQGSLGELLAVGACVRLLKDLQRQKRLPQEARIYVGDAVSVPLLGKPDFAKGADMHILVLEDSRKGTTIRVVGVVEVKSYALSAARLFEQTRQHVRRAARGVRLGEKVYDSGQIRIGCPRSSEMVKIGVVPARWPLLGTFHFEEQYLIVDPATPPPQESPPVSLGENQWRITLRWSHEALAQAAYEMTFWYMGKIGEIIYRDGVPQEWSEMTPGEAGCNAVKMMLYYAILRCRTKWEQQRAVALYNTYGFGYALGMNLKDENGIRQMLWPEDLREILVSGETKHGYTLAE
jgi:hypothetical protein